jgi:predicted Rossmann-fold nucleotide-binding protein
MRHKEIDNEDKLIELLKSTTHVRTTAFQSIDFQKVATSLLGKTFDDCIFLGCKLPVSFEEHLRNKNLVFPVIDVPFNSYRGELYNKDSLYGEYKIGKPDSYDKTLDRRIYKHYLKEGKEAGDIKETLSRRLHDHAITDALYDFLAKYDEKKVVAIMGGHSLPRDNENFLRIAKISKQLTESGHLMVSGGGPGAMEATHVGAWFAGKDEKQLIEAVKTLAKAPIYKDELWLDMAFRVIEEHPEPEYESIGIPTWLYGHEPPTPFATHIAKYFANSVREDGLLTIAKGGVIFSPGNAGTVQEIFQDATKNHYLSFGYSSPMVFLNTSYWSKEYPIYPMLKQLAETGKYQNMILSSYDAEKDVVAEIEKFTSEK